METSTSTHRGPARAERSFRLRSAVSRENIDIIVLAALLILTACFGRSFSQIGWSGGSIYVTEIALLVVAVAAVARHGARGTMRLLASRLPISLLAILWLALAIATVRGLIDFGLDLTLNDIGIVEYSALLPIVVLVADTRRRRDLLLQALVAGGIGAVIVFGASDLIARITDSSPPLGDQQGQLGFLGLYILFYVAWLAARHSNGFALGPADLLLGSVAMIEIGLTDKRTIWLAALVVIASVALLTPPPRRLRFALTAAAAVVVAGGSAYGIERALGPYGEPEPAAVTTAEADRATEGLPEREGSVPVASVAATPATAQLLTSQLDTQIGRELGGLDGGPETESANTAWRLAYWGEILERSLDSPLIGVGLGRPSEFVWEGKKYDFREGPGPDVWSDVTSPHNGFLDVLYRAGIFGLAALVGLIVVATARTRGILRGPVERAERTRLVALLAMFAGTIAVVALNDALRGPFLGVFFWVTLGLLFASVAVEDDREAGPGRQQEGAS